MSQATPVTEPGRVPPLPAVFAILLCAASPAAAQWAATYGDRGRNHAESVQQTRDGGYVMTGFTIRPGSRQSEVFVMKFDAGGHPQWQRSYEGARDDAAYSIQQTADGGYVVAGRTRSFGASYNNLWLLKLHPDGAVAWQKAYAGVGAVWPRAIHLAKDGGYVVAGLLSVGPVGSKFWVTKVGEDGGVEWQKAFGGKSDEYAYAMEPTSDAGYIVGGYTTSFGAGGKDVWIVKLGADGSIEWQRAYGGRADEEARALWQTSDGGFVVAASTESFGAGGHDLWVLKLNASGNAEWQRTYGGSGDEFRVRGIRQTPDAGYVVAVGETNSFGAGSDDAWLLRLDAAGDVVWQKTYGGFDYDEAECLRPTDDGGYIVCGNTRSFGEGGEDFWIMKLAPDGSICPSCPISQETGASPLQSAAEVATTAAIVRDIPAIPRDTAATVRETTYPARFLCPGEVCYGGADDDGDGLIDCDDPGCDGQFVCLSDLVSEPEGSFVSGPASSSGGTVVAARLQVTNHSPSKKPASFQVASFLSDDATPGPGDTLEMVQPVGSLGAGDTVVIEVGFAKAKSMVGKFLITWIDAARTSPRGDMEESNERNNLVVGRIQ